MKQELNIIFNRKEALSKEIQNSIFEMLGKEGAEDIQIEIKIHSDNEAIEENNKMVREEEEGSPEGQEEVES